MTIHKDSRAYNAAKSADEKRICDLLAKTIDAALKGAENKVWHRHPVWFLDGNPIVGYSKRKAGINLMFWSGQSFDEPGLTAEGSFKAAEVKYFAADQVNVKDLKRWLKKSIEIQWDYKNIVKRKGRLERLAVGSESADALRTVTPAPKAPTKATSKRTNAKGVADKDAKPRLLSGGNPQIGKADGDAAVQAYLDAMPEWKQDIGRRLDALVTRAVPKVRKAVRWNTPFYGIEGMGWFLAFHCITKYVKVAFLNGTKLQPMPPVESKKSMTRYLHIHEGEWGSKALDEKQLERWVKQASKEMGEECF
jgi:hypothetical protein